VKGKRKVLLSLMILLSLFLWSSFKAIPEMKALLVDSKAFNKLDYICLSKDFLPDSLSVYDSDISKNLLIMEQVVGTLVKFGEGGGASPYLAEKWERNHSGRVWNFTFKENLLTEDGVPINAKNYMKGFLLVLKKLSKKSDPPVFKELLGYEGFKKGESELLGLRVLDEKTIEFSFNKKVSGILEFLAMPYYGFYSLENFTGSSWKDKGRIISSGAYSVSLWSGDKVSLKRRDFNLNKKGMPESVDIYFKKIEKGERFVVPTIIHTKKPLEEKITETYNIESIPTFLMAIVLSPFKDNFLKSIEVRRYIRSKILSLNLEKYKKNSLYRVASGFYHAENDRYKKEREKKLVIPQELLESSLSLEIATAATADMNEFIHIKSVMDDVFEGTKVSLEWKRVDRSMDKEAIDRYFSNKYYDMRLSTVNSGSYPVNWIVEMMFASRLGISFPDSEGHILDLVKKYENEEMKVDVYLEKFEKIVFNDSVVIPVLHSSFNWIVTDNIISDSLDITSSVSRFDLVRLEQ
jgi:ABC-type oligopeptide transport system substrate-binding subunit